MKTRKLLALLAILTFGLTVTSAFAGEDAPVRGSSGEGGVSHETGGAMKRLRQMEEIVQNKFDKEKISSADYDTLTAKIFGLRGRLNEKVKRKGEEKRAFKQEIKEALKELKMDIAEAVNAGKDEAVLPVSNSTERKKEKKEEKSRHKANKKNGSGSAV